MLSVIASLFVGSSLAAYAYYLIKGKSDPNPATWAIWCIIGLMNLFTYFFVVDGNLLQSLPLVASVTGVSLITIHSVLKRRFARMTKKDLLFFGLALAVGVLWQVTGDPIIANLALQVVYLISYVPTFVALRAGHIRDSPVPWLLATFGYGLMIVAILLDWENQTWVALAHPIANGIIGNGTLGYFSIRSQRIDREKWLVKKSTSTRPQSIRSLEKI